MEQLRERLSKLVGSSSKEVRLWFAYPDSHDLHHFEMVQDDQYHVVLDDMQFTDRVRVLIESKRPLGDSLSIILDDSNAAMETEGELDNVEWPRDTEVFRQALEKKRAEKEERRRRRFQAHMGEEGKGGRKKTNGVTGLVNLGNTCFMNSALQCLSNAPMLTEYFLRDQHKRELNPTNPLGMQGKLALSYGETIQQLWSSNSSRSYAPRSLKWTLGSFSRQFLGFRQHDSQELLATLLDGLHEDLNRIVDKPYVVVPDANGRPDPVVASEAWDAYLKRNDSVIVDYFQGQYKSTVTCPNESCGNVSVTFDPFMYLTLPLPEEHKSRALTVHFHPRQPHSYAPPVLYSVSVRDGAKIVDLKKQLALLAGTLPDHLLVAIVENHHFKRLLKNNNVLSAVKDSDSVHVFETLKLHGLKRPPPSSANPSAREMLLYQRRPRLALLDGLSDEDSPVKKTKLTSSRRGRGAGDIDNGDSNTASSKRHNPIERLCGFPKVLSFHVDEDEATEAASPEPVSEEDDVLNMEDSKKDESPFPSHPHSLDIDVPGLDLGGVSTGAAAYAFMQQYVRPIVGDLASLQKYALPSPGGSASSRASTPTGSSSSKNVRKTSVRRRSRRTTASQYATATIEEKKAKESISNGDSPFPFSLFYGLYDGVCLKCEDELCPGCFIPPSESVLFDPQNNATLVIEWNRDAWAAILARASDTRVDVHESTVRASGLSRSTRSDVENKGVPLDACFELFTEEEKLRKSDPWYCSHCKDFQCATKKLDLWRLPEILIIHLKRFRFSHNRRDKITTAVDFPLRGLDVSRWVSPSFEGDMDELATPYDLFAVSNHSGGLGGGHYTAHARNVIDNQWYYFNDSVVSPVNEGSVRSKNAYMLFYRKRRDLSGLRSP